MEIKNLIKDKYYRIKGSSRYFETKYGTANPLFRYEFTDIDAWDRSWQDMHGNPCAELFRRRKTEDNLFFDLSDRVCYGQIKAPGDSNISLSELVHPSELEG